MLALGKVHLFSSSAGPHRHAFAPMMGREGGREGEQQQRGMGGGGGEQRRMRGAKGEGGGGEEAKGEGGEGEQRGRGSKRECCA